MCASTIAHGRHILLSFYLPPSVGLLLTIWTRFSVRVYDRAWEYRTAVPRSTQTTINSTVPRHMTASTRKISTSGIYPINTNHRIQYRTASRDRPHISTTTTTIHKQDPKLKQYRTAITPLASKQYSTYAVTIVTFSCLPREAPFLREIRTLRQVAHKLHGYIYTMGFALRGNAALAIYFNAVISTASGHRWSPCPTIYF